MKRYKTRESEIKSIKEQLALMQVYASKKSQSEGKTTERLQRLDLHGELREKVLPLCRLKYGEIWEDPVQRHRVGVLDATKLEDVKNGEEKAKLVVNDPPYNVPVGNANTNALFKINIEKYLEFSEKWVRNAILVMDKNAHFYIWLGADYRDNLQPLPDFIILMREFKELKPKNIITLRNQRGYGTQKNWMWVRQELLYYVKGNPEFKVEAEYTDIPKILRGYYKEVNGRITENLERGKSKYIRAGNVWVDIQQVFYRYEYMLMFLLDRKAITFKQYEKLREDYVSSNQYRNFLNMLPEYLARCGINILWI
ncbi:MAG: DNA methyltransferase [bacterium]|nr:DNA methyltransferase [bacterium]